VSQLVKVVASPTTAGSILDLNHRTKSLNPFGKYTQNKCA